MRKIFVVMFVLVCLGGNVFAANGDLIVNGNLGVGVTSPTYKLDVAGQIHATQGPGVYEWPAAPCGFAPGFGTVYWDAACSVPATVSNTLIISDSPIQLYGKGTFGGCTACTSGNPILKGRLIAP